MRISALITGVAGFIGSSLARALVERGWQVRGIDNLSTGHLQNIADIAGSVDFQLVDVTNPQDVLDVCRGIDYVFHEAAIASVPASVDDPIGSHHAIATGTIHVLAGARAAGVRRVIYAASSSAYGSSPELPKSEFLLPNPQSPYAAAKLAGEHYMRAFSHSMGLDTVSLRYFNVYGPRQDPGSPYSGVLSRFIAQMLRGEVPTVYGDGEQTRDFIYVRDVVEANIAAAEAAGQFAGEVFNIGTGVGTSLNRILASLRPLTGYEGTVRYAGERPGGIRHSLADINRARQQLGFSPRLSLEEGLKRTVHWFREARQLTPAA